MDILYKTFKYHDDYLYPFFIEGDKVEMLIKYATDKRYVYVTSTNIDDFEDLKPSKIDFRTKILSKVDRENKQQIIIFLFEI